MKRLITSILLIHTALSSICADSWCNIHLKDGSHLSYLISGKLTLTPSSDILTIHSQDFQTQYSLSNILSYSFSTESIENAIDHPSLPDIQIRFITPDQITISGIQPNQPIRIHSTNGTQYPPQILTRNDTDQTITLSLASLPPSIYLITLPQTSLPALKILKK